MFLISKTFKSAHSEEMESAQVRKMRKLEATLPLKQAQFFAVMIEQNIPNFVIERLRPMKEKLRDGMKGLSPEQRDELQAALKKSTVEFDSDFNQWNEMFMACFQSPDRNNLAEQILALPEPPPEPPGMWKRLLNQAQQEGTDGVAACLALYNMGCARSVRQFQKSKNNPVAT